MQNRRLWSEKIFVDLNAVNLLIFTHGSMNEIYLIYWHHFEKLYSMKIFLDIIIVDNTERLY